MKHPFATTGYASIAPACLVIGNQPMTDQTTPVWTEGVSGDGVVILRDGLPVKIEDVLATLNELEEYRTYRRHEDEIVRKEREEDRRFEEAAQRWGDVFR